MAQSGHELVHCQCPLSGVKRTSQFALQMSDYDPKHPFAVSLYGLKTGCFEILCASIRPSIGTEQSIPEEVNYSKIVVCVPVMNEMQFLLPPEPRKSLKP
jgi:hypothetical protein